MRRSMRMLAWALVMCVGSMQPAFAESADLEKTLRSLNASKQEASRLREEIEETEKALERLREKATEHARSVQRAERAASSADKQLAATVQSLDKAQAKYNEERDSYSAALQQLLQLRRLPPTAFFGDEAQVASMVKTAGALSLAERALSERALAMKKNLDTLVALKDTLVAQRNQSKARQKNLSVAQTQLERDLAARQKLQAALRTDHKEAEAKVAKLAKKSSSLGELIGKLDGAKPATAARNSSNARWQPPVVGEVIRHFGDKKLGTDTYRGIVLKARNNATVIAPSAGKVVFTGPFRDYGEMVLVRHDDTYISLLAGLGQIDVAFNQDVASGEPIGRMKPEKAPKLYMELRKSGKTIDPDAWYAKLGSRIATNN